MVTTSNLSASKGRFRASALEKFRYGRAFRPCASIPSLKSVAKTVAPALKSGSEDEPGPAARSKITMPGAGAMILVAALRQALVRPKLKRSLTRSYRLATPSNIAATSSGSLFKLARDMRIFSLEVGSSTTQRHNNTGSI